MAATGGGSRTGQRSELSTGGRSPFLRPLGWELGARLRAEALERDATIGPRQFLPDHLRDELVQDLDRAAQDDRVEALMVLTKLDQESFNPVSSNFAGVTNFLEFASSWFSARGGRTNENRKRPADEEIRQVFGEDWRVVKALWPVLAHIGDRFEDASVVDDSAVLLLAMRDPFVVERLALWLDKRLRVVLPKSTTDAERLEAKDKVLDRLKSDPDWFSGLVAERDADSLRKFIRTTFDRAARDAVPAKAVMAGKDGKRQVVLRSQRTRRRLRHQMDGDASSPEAFGRALEVADRRRHHRGLEGYTIAEAAEHLERHPSTVRKALHELERVHGPGPKEGRYYRLTSHWISLLRMALADVEARDAYDLGAAAKLLGLDEEELKETLRRGGPERREVLDRGRITDDELQHLERWLQVRGR